MHKPVKVHVPRKFTKIKDLIAWDKGIQIIIDFQEGKPILLLTQSQIINMQNAKHEEKKSISPCFSPKQV